MFHSGSIVLPRIEAEGDRIQSSDVDFLDELDQPAEVDVATGKSDQVLQYDLPQGTYEQIVLHRRFESQGPDLPAIEIEGEFTDTQEEKIHIIEGEKFDATIELLLPIGLARLRLPTLNMPAGCRKVARKLF